MSASLVETLSEKIVSSHNARTGSINDTVAGVLQHQKISDEGVHRVCAEVNRRILERLKASSAKAPLWSTRQSTAKPDQVLALLGRGAPQNKTSAAKPSKMVKTSSAQGQVEQIEVNPAELVKKLSQQTETMWAAWKLSESKPTKTSAPLPAGMILEQGEQLDAKAVIVQEFNKLEEAIEKASGYLFQLERDLLKVRTGYEEQALDLQSGGLTSGEVFKAVLSQARDEQQAATLVGPLLPALGFGKQSSWDHRKFQVRDTFQEPDPSHPLLQSARELLSKTEQYKTASAAQRVLLQTRDYRRRLLEDALERAEQA